MMSAINSVSGACKDSPGTSGDEDYPAITYPSARLGAITRKSNEISKLLKDYSEENKVKVKDLHAVLQTKIENFQEACRLQENRDDVAECEMTDFLEWHRKHISIAQEFSNEIHKWLVQPAPDDISPGDSASQVNYDASVVSNKALLQRQIKAEMKQKLELEKLAIEEKLIEEKLNYEKKQIELKRERQKLSSKYESEEIELLREISTRKENSNTEERKTSGVATAPALPASPAIENTALRAVFNLPRNEPEIFDGDITCYQSFTLAFDRLIAEAYASDADKYYYLQRYTKGYPLELVKSCLSSDFTHSYIEARILLHKYYGNEAVLAQKYLDKLEEWPSIKAEDKKSLDAFALYLTTCLNMLPNNSYLNQLNTWKEIKMLVMKLPFDLRKVFRNKTADMQSRNLPVTFATFVKFVQT